MKRFPVLNNCSEEIEQFIKDLVLIVEKEVTAFETLRNALSGQKSFILENVEQRYIRRLKDLKEMLYVLLRKFQNGQREIRDCIELSIKFIDQHLEQLIRDGNEKGPFPLRENLPFSSRPKVGQVHSYLTHTSPFQR